MIKLKYYEKSIGGKKFWQEEFFTNYEDACNRKDFLRRVFGIKNIFIYDDMDILIG